MTAGGIPTSLIGRSVANYSGHILKLVPGDYNYAFPLFPIVIVWNGENKFTPTQFTKANAVCDFKLGIVDRHLSEATALFEEVEEDLKDPVLNQSFNDLRCQVVLTKQVLGDRMKGITHTIPPVAYGPRTGTTSDLTYQFPKGYVPTPFIRHDIDPSVGDPQPRPAKSTDEPVAPSQIETEQSAPVQGITGTFFVGFSPSPYWKQCTQDFCLPFDIPMHFMSPSQEFPAHLFKSQTGSTQSQSPTPSQSQSQTVQTQTVQTQTVQTQTQSQPGSSQSQIDPTQSQPGSSQSQIDPTQSQQVIDISQAIPSSYPTSYQIPALQPQVVITSRPALSTRKSAPSATVTSSSSIAPVPPPPPPPSMPSLPPKKYKCRYCNYSTDRKNDWTNHCNIHTGTTFKCGSCSKRFHSDKNRTIHFKQVHLKQHRAICSVDNCNFSCNDFGILKVHQYDVHQIGVEPKCQGCDKRFGNFRVLERHRKVCNIPKDKECPVCGKQYKDTERLANHMDKAHKGTPKMICDQCGKIFISKDSLRVHKSREHS